MEKNGTLRIQWQGPFSWDTLSPDSKPGVYLWTVKASGSNRYLLSYVGQSGNVRKRIRDEISDLLGGKYWVWEIEDLRASILKRGIYEPDQQCNQFYCQSFDAVEDRFQKALLNLREFRFFFAVGQQFEDAAVRSTVESALLKNAQRSGLYLSTKSNLDKPCLQNSRFQEPIKLVDIESVFKVDELVVIGLNG